MLFNSFSFAIFLPIVFILFWLLQRGKLEYQNRLLLIASYIFYAGWDLRFLFLLIFSTVLDYYTGIKMAESETKNQKKIWFWLSISINLGFLGVFKYFNFFATSFSEALSHLGMQVNAWSLKVILPVGISFYTFHGLSYVIDIYNSKIKPERDFVIYSLFVSFFPLLVAGPIERATHLLPQIQQKRVFKYQKCVDGLRQILWGLFKKIVIADNCAQYTNIIFNNSEDYNGSTLFLGAILFAFQIYCDFSGYSDIALGTARLLGIELLRNFSFPYFSRDIAEFWRRWHISLSTWFRDYLYIPLGGSKGGTWMKVRNTFIIFLVSGFWHGANWTFIVWGLLNALFIMPSILLKTNRDNLEIVAKDKNLPTFKEFLSITLTFSLVVLAWVFFRADNISQAIGIVSEIFSFSFFNKLQLLPKSLFVLIILFMITEWRGRHKQYGLQIIENINNAYIRFLFYYVIIGVILLFGNFSENQFIYFQF